MDSDVKKRRRRSIRNIRRSANFAPPTTTYGSAWFGEGQETNISNLVKSLEELDCHDDINTHLISQSVRDCSQQDLQHYGEEARDAFSPDNSNTVLFASGDVQKTLEEDHKRLLNGFKVQGVPKSNFSQLSQDLSQFNLSPVITVSEAEALNQEGEGNGTNKLVSAHEVITAQTNVTPSPSDTNFGKDGLYSDSGTSLPSCNTQMNDYIENKGSGKHDNRVIDSYCFKSPVRGESEIQHRDDEIMMCYRTSYKDLDENNDMQNRYSNLKQKSPNDSMSPEFADFCPNSAESSVSMDPMNQAINSFLDASMGSFFNMSFSPMEGRPGTPNISSSLLQHSDSNASSERVAKGDELQHSISSIISLSDDSIISSDPITYHECVPHNTSNVSSSTSIPSKSLPPAEPQDNTVVDSVSNVMNRTYLIEEADTDCDTPIKTIIPMESESVCEERSCQQHNINDEHMIESHLVGSQQSASPTYNCYASEENSHLCPSRPLEEFSKTSLEVPQLDMDHINLNEGENVLSMGVIDCGVESSSVTDSNLCSIEHQSDRPSQSTLADCGNVIISQDETIPKKMRRRSDRLAPLESESAVMLNSSNDPCCHNGDKENEMCEEFVEVQNSPPSDNSGQRKTRTRRGRKSWDLRKGTELSAGLKNSSSVVENDCETFTSTELEDLQNIYGKQKYVEQSPQRLETIKEISEDKNAFLKRRQKRYLEFGSINQAKEKKRMKKALSIYNGRQCYFPITQQDFDRKMLDVQLLLDS